MRTSAPTAAPLAACSTSRASTPSKAVPIALIKRRPGPKAGPSLFSEFELHGAGVARPVEVGEAPSRGRPPHGPAARRPPAPRRQRRDAVRELDARDRDLAEAPYGDPERRARAVDRHAEPPA